MITFLVLSFRFVFVLHLFDLLIGKCYHLLQSLLLVLFGFVLLNLEAMGEAFAAGLL
jgi:hypothetical protein